MSQCLIQDFSLIELGARGTLNCLIGFLWCRMLLHFQCTYIPTPGPCPCMHCEVHFTVCNVVPLWSRVVSRTASQLGDNSTPPTQMLPTANSQFNPSNQCASRFALLFACVDLAPWFALSVLRNVYPASSASLASRWVGEWTS